MVSQFLILFIKTTPVNKRPSIFISSYVARIFTHIASLGTKSDLEWHQRRPNVPFRKRPQPPQTQKAIERLARQSTIPHHCTKKLITTSTCTEPTEDTEEKHTPPPTPYHGSFLESEATSDDQSPRTPSPS